MSGAFGLHRNRGWLVARCAGLMLGLARPAAAETGLLVPPATARSSEAATLAREAQLLFEEHWYGEACRKLARSYFLEHHIATLLNLAACHEAEGSLALASSEFTEARALAEGEGRPDFVKVAQPRIDDLAPRISTLLVVVPEEFAVLEVEVLLDGEPLPAWGVETPVDPGTHALTARSPLCTSWTTKLTLSAGEHRSTAVPALYCRREDSEPPGVAAAAARSASPGWRGQRVLGGLLLGVGFVAVPGGVVALILFRSRSDRESTAPPCYGICARPQRDAAERARLSAIWFGVGATAIAAGTVLWLTAPSPSRHVALRLGVAPGMLHARMNW